MPQCESNPTVFGKIGKQGWTCCPFDVPSRWISGLFVWGCLTSVCEQKVRSSSHWRAFLGISYREKEFAAKEGIYWCILSEMC